ncbi:MAG: right-handed parallel beta-helix repeat-containing protein [Spiribacter salinus]|uniref:Right-handed parallel beta-helix repeat-containing protein n=1 Tax=Spiribacter salinus TaxID=1335746 RepID=A0A540VQL0_9GAMM|nr:MAG: right-handed parallel beta-helix repeat-containing protein [Spiribacter salinus]
MRHIIAACALLLGAASAFPQSSRAQAPEALPALDEYVQQHCDFTESQWCRLQTSNSFEDVMWPGDIPGRAGCCHDPRRTFTDYNGMAFDGRNLYFHGGGHAGYAGNEVYRLDLAALKWERLNDPAPLTDEDFIDEECPVPAADRGIYAGHTYGSPLVTDGVLHVWSQNPKCDGHGTRGPAVYGQFDLEERAWRERTTAGHATSSSVLLGENEAVAIGQGRSPALHFYDLDRGEKVGQQGAPTGWIRFGASARTEEEFVFRDKDMLRRMRITDIGLRGDGAAELPASLGANGGVAYHPGQDAYLLWDGGQKVYAIDRDLEGGWRVYEDDGPPDFKNVFSKWRYVPAAEVVIGVGQHDQLWLFRPMEPVDPDAALGDYECSDRVPMRECPRLADQLSGGGEVELVHGVYEQCMVVKRPTVVRGNGSVITGAVCHGKAAFVSNADLELHDLACENHNVRDGNGACVRQQRGSLLLSNVEVRNSQNSVLAGDGVGDLTFDNVRVENVGGECSVRCGRAHGVYYRGEGTLTIRDSVLRAPKDEGHLVKSGAARTVIERTTLDERGGFGSRVVDAYNGGELVIRDSTIIAAQQDGNAEVIGYDYEARREHARNRIELSGGRIDCAGGPLLAGRNSLEAADIDIEAERENCR